MSSYLKSFQLVQLSLTHPYFPSNISLCTSSPGWKVSQVKAKLFAPMKIGNQNS